MDSGSDWERFQACVQAGCTQLVSCYAAVLSMEKNKFDRFVLAFYKRTRELLSYKRGVSRLKYCKWLVVTSFPFPNLLIVQYFILQFKCNIFDNFYMRTIFKGVVLGGGVPRPIFVKFIMWIYSIWIFKEENHLSWPPLDPLC